MAQPQDTGQLSPRLRRASKWMARVLRHDPQGAGVDLNPRGGWAEVHQLLAASRAAGIDLSREELDQVVAEPTKQRYQYSPDGRQVRAVQGHSVAVELEYEASQPPLRLYHGTVARALGDIYRHGLRSMRRHAVHLSPDVETARLVGARRGTPVVLPVEASQAHADGYSFTVAPNGVWLAQQIPPQYLGQPLYLEP